MFNAKYYCVYFLIIAINMKARIKYLIGKLLVLFCFAVVQLHAQPLRIPNFSVKENLTQNGKLAIVALDSASRPLEHINGRFVFSLNGFEQSLHFHEGIAVVQQPVTSSTFVLFKHINPEKNVSKLYYIYKKEGKLNPIKINGLLLLIIPAGILLIAYLFRKFLVTLLLLAVVYAYFHFAQGLDFPTMLENGITAVKELF